VSGDNCNLGESRQGVSNGEKEEDQQVEKKEDYSNEGGTAGYPHGLLDCSRRALERRERVWFTGNHFTKGTENIFEIAMKRGRDKATRRKNERPLSYPSRED